MANNINDSIYYNINIDGDDGVTLADFSETRVRNILENPSDYDVAVVRFKIPSYELPLFFFEDGMYRCSIRYDDALSTIPIIYEPVKNTSIYNKKTIWSINQFVRGVNIAFDIAFTNLKTSRPLAPMTEAPFIVWDVNTQLFQLYAEQSYDNPLVKICMNDDLYYFFRGFYSYTDTTLANESNQIYVRSTQTNTTTYNGKAYYIMTQETKSIFNWIDIKNFVFETSTIPVNPENQSGQSNKFQSIITDFEPLDGFFGKDAYQFFPNGPIRWYDLTSTYPLKNIDLRIKWTANDGSQYPLFINGRVGASVKIQFKRVVER